ncbi:hemerythrin domain-containing protein [Azospirillum rugosum]|uniref:Hemerythrin superfamily protein n=1 Tax=Azospirillum rugosum TaxID=416170 RepID=A0ABS4SQU6_9PROT|nr:hemerythrin domain-containing protein [Azospirillum rugosum]MBP2294947.1 hemerythrin superfamily protein [Azospirillum rugosum]
MARRGSGLLSAGGMAAFAGGAVVALVASRLLPPLFAQAAGSVSGRDPFAALADDHRHIMALLNEMEQTPQNATFRRTQLLLRLKRRLAAHALAEEDVVYPLLHDRAHEEGDTRRLYGEHADMKMHLSALERMPKDDPNWLGRVTELKMLIAEHVHQEEAIDFPKLRDALGRRAISRLSGSVRREKALLL